MTGNKTVSLTDLNAGAGNPKAFSSLQARCALAGVVLAAIRNDAERWAYVVTRGAYTRELESLEAVEAWLVERATNQEALGHV